MVAQVLGGRAGLARNYMAWVVIDAQNNVLRIENSIEQPINCTSVFIDGVNAWPAQTIGNAILRVINGVVTWVDMRTPAEKKSAKWSEFKSARSAAINAPLSTTYGVFDSNADARANIAEVVQRAQLLTSLAQPVAISFTLANNEVIVMDMAMIVAVALALGAKTQAARDAATALRLAIFNPATTPEQLNALSWAA